MIYDLKKIFDPNAERIMLSNNVEDGEALIYQVPAESNFYLKEASLSMQNDGVEEGFAYVYWHRPIGDVYVRDLCQIWFWETGAKLDTAWKSDHARWPSGLLIPAGEEIWVNSDEVEFLVEGNISGFLVRDYA